MKTLLRSLLFLILATNGALAQSVGGGAGPAGSGGTVTQGPAAGSGPWIVTPWIAGAVNSATNGLYTNALQGNAVLSATNGLYTNVLQGNVALSVTNGIYANILQGNAVLSIANPIFSASVIQPVTNAQGYNLTPVVSGALEASHIFKGSAGNLYSAYVTSTTGAAGYFICVNTTTISAGAVTPIDFVAIPAGPSTIGFNYSPGPPGNYSTGVTCAVTTAATPFTYTAGGSVFAYHGLVD